MESQVRCRRAEDLPRAPEAEILLRVPPGVIEVEADPGRPRELGRIAGAEGLGSQLLCARGTDLYALRLDLNPAEEVDLAPLDLLGPAFSTLRQRARPGTVQVQSWPKGPLMADGIWLTPALESALLSFSGLVIDPPEVFAATIKTLDVVEVAAGVMVGLDPQAGTLALIAVEGFARSQNVYGVGVSAHSHSPRLLELLNQAHAAFWNEEDAPEALQHEGGALAAEERSIFERLIAYHARDLATRERDQVVLRPLPPPRGPSRR